MKSIRMIVAFTFMASAVSLAQVKKDTLRVLFVGNSYTYFNNLPQIVSIISDSAQIKVRSYVSVLGGAKLSDHWRSAGGLKTREILEKGKFNVVVLQENSMSPVLEPDSTLKYIRLFSQLITSKKAKTYLYVTWAREKVPQHQEQINAVFSRASVENKILIVPAGQAWETARQLRPSLSLYNSDGSHPNPLGTFLTACVFCATLTGEVPRKLTPYYWSRDHFGEPMFLMYVDPLDAEFCQRIAERVTKGFKTIPK